MESLAVTPDGKLLASGSWDTIKLWSLPDGRLLETLTGHKGSVESLAVTPDGKLLIAGSLDNTIKLWSLPDGRLLETLADHTNSVESVAITPDCTLLASGTNDGTVMLWSLPDGRLLETLTDHTNSVESVAITPDCNLLVSGGLEGEIILWDLQRIDETKQLFSRLSDPASAEDPLINDVPLMIGGVGVLMFLFASSLTVRFSGLLVAFSGPFVFGALVDGDWEMASLFSFILLIFAVVGGLMLYVELDR